MSRAARTVSFVCVVPQFSVPDLVRTAEYYRDVLGFEIDSYWDGERASLTPNEHLCSQSYLAVRCSCSSIEAITQRFERVAPKVLMTRTSA